MPNSPLCVATKSRLCSVVLIFPNKCKSCHATIFDGVTPLEHTPEKHFFCHPPQRNGPPHVFFCQGFARHPSETAAGCCMRSDRSPCPYAICSLRGRPCPPRRSAPGTSDLEAPEARRPASICFLGDWVLGWMGGKHCRRRCTPKCTVNLECGWSGDTQE